MAGIAQALDRKLVPHPRMEALLRRTMRDVEPNASQLKMCEVPEQARLIDSPDLWFPLVVIENVYVFPGVPKLLRKKFESAREHFNGQPFFLRQVFVRCMESDIAQDLNALLVDYPELALGSYPQMHEGHYRTLLTLESHDESYVVRALDALLARIPESQLLGVE